MITVTARGLSTVPGWVTVGVVVGFSAEMDAPINTSVNATAKKPRVT
jgi:hypothetical protein